MRYERGYDGGVLFENLELIRTIKAASGCERVLLDLHVRRRPPDARHFWSQRTRQASDSIAQPTRMAAELGIRAADRRSAARGPIPGRVIAAAGPPLVAAEFGRRRASGSTTSRLRRCCGSLPGCWNVVAAHGLR